MTPSRWRRAGWRFKLCTGPCNSAEWTAAVAGFAGSSAGVVGTALAIPAGPADWALLGAALLGVGGSGAAVVNCATK